MVLEVLSALGAYASGAYSYNMGRFQFDAGQKQNTGHQQQNMSVALWGLFREDLRDLFGMTTDKMSTYMVVATLIFGMAVNYIFNASADFPKEPGFLLMAWTVTVYASMAYSILAVWLAMHGSNAAHAASIKLLLQAVRPPIASNEEVKQVSNDLEKYEKSGPLAFLQLPKFFGGTQSGGGDGASGQQEDRRSSVSSRKRSSIFNVQQMEQVQAARRLLKARSGAQLGGNALHGAHLELFKKQQQSYVCFEGYARVCILCTTHQLMLTSGYYMMAHFMVKFNENGLPDQNRAAGWMSMISLMVCMVTLFKLDMFTSDRDMRLLKCLTLAGPIVGCLACQLWSMDATRKNQGKERLFPEFVSTLLAALCCFLQASYELLVCWLARPGGSTAKLPTKFRSVRYIDVFGWWIRGTSDSAQSQAARPIAAEAETTNQRSNNRNERSNESSDARKSVTFSLDQRSGVGASRRASSSATSTGASRRASIGATSTSQQVRKLKRTIHRMLNSIASDHLSEQEKQGLEDLEEVLEAADGRLEEIRDESAPSSQSGAVSCSSAINGSPPQREVEMPRRSSIRRQSVCRQRRMSAGRRSSLITPWVQLSYFNDYGQPIPYYVNSESDEVLWEAPADAVMDIQTIDSAVKFLHARVAQIKEAKEQQANTVPESATVPEDADRPKSDQPNPSHSTPSSSSSDEEEEVWDPRQEDRDEQEEQGMAPQHNCHIDGSLDSSVSMQCVPPRPGSRHDPAAMPWRYFWQLSTSVACFWVLSGFWVLLDCVPGADQVLVSWIALSELTPESTPHANPLDFELLSVNWPHRFFRPSALGCEGSHLVLGDRFTVHTLKIPSPLAGSLVHLQQSLAARELPPSWRALDVVTQRGNDGLPIATLLVLEAEGRVVMEHSLASGTAFASDKAAPRRWAISISLGSTLRTIVAVPEGSQSEAAHTSITCGERTRSEVLVPWALYGSTAKGDVVALCPRRRTDNSLELEPVYAIADTRGENWAVNGLHMDENGTLWYLMEQATVSSAELHAWTAEGDHQYWRLPGGRRWASGLCALDGAQGLLAAATAGTSSPHTRPELWHLKPSLLSEPTSSRPIITA